MIKRLQSIRAAVRDWHWRQTAWAELEQYPTARLHVLSSRLLYQRWPTPELEEKAMALNAEINAEFARRRARGDVDREFRELAGAVTLHNHRTCRVCRILGNFVPHEPLAV